MTRCKANRFHDHVVSEVVAGNDFMYRNAIGPEGQLSGQAIAEIVSSLSGIRPGFSGGDDKRKNASLFVLAGGEPGFLLGLLDSLVYHRTSTLLDVIIIPFYGSIGGSDIIAQIPWLEIAGEEQGVLDLARVQAEVSDFALFVTQYERLGPGVVDELIHALETCPSAGCVGAKIVGRDGVVLEAGGVCYFDVGLDSLGRGLDPNAPELCYAKKVNAFSGSFAIAFDVLLAASCGAESWRCDYFDFFYLFHEVQRRGFSNWVVPLACTVGYGGKFVIKPGDWQRVSGVTNSLARLLRDYPEIYEETQASGKYLGSARVGRVLYLDLFVPDHEADAGSVVCINILKALLRLGWAVTFVPVGNRDFDIRKARILSRLGVEVVYESNLDSVDNILSVCPEGFDLLFGVRVTVMAALLDFVATSLPHCPFIFLDADLHYLREMREAELRSDLKLYANAVATKREEYKCFAQAHCNIVHTDVERKIVETELSIQNVVELPYSVDVRPSTSGFDDRKDIMFLGGYEHMPNSDAVRYFVGEVWPRIRPRLLDKSRLFLVGSKPGPEVMALACDDVVVTGQVQDINCYFNSARVFVAPLRYGAGVKGKVLTALAHGVPLVATSIASEGLPLNHGKEYFCANDTESFADEVLKLFHDRETWERVQKSGYEFVENFAARRAFDDAIKKAISVARENWIDERRKRG